MFDQIENFMENIRTLIIAQPVLFVLVTGLIIAIISVLGEIAVYWIARVGGRALISRLSRCLRVDPRHVERAEALFLRWGVSLVIFGRILPGVRTAVSVPAGMTRMNFALFLGASFGGAYFWNTLLVGISYLLGFQLSLFGISIL